MLTKRGEILDNLSAAALINTYVVCTFKTADF